MKIYDIGRREWIEMEPYKFTIFETNCPTCKSPVRYTTNDRDLTCHGCHTTFEGVA